jgi:hypothetical protein
MVVHHGHVDQVTGFDALGGVLLEKVDSQAGVSQVHRIDDRYQV